jgi:hypothetical protein
MQTPQPDTAVVAGPPILIIVFVILGVILVLVLVILYLVLAGKPRPLPSSLPPTTTSSQGSRAGKPLKTPITSLPEPHVLRIAIDWPPKPPALLQHPTKLPTKTGREHLQGQDPLHQA